MCFSRPRSIFIIIPELQERLVFFFFFFFFSEGVWLDFKIGAAGEEKEKSRNTWNEVINKYSGGGTCYGHDGDEGSVEDDGSGDVEDDSYNDDGGGSGERAL